MTDLIDQIIRSFDGEDGGHLGLLNLRDGKVHADTVDVSVCGARGKARAQIVTLTPQTAVTVATELLIRAASSPRLEPNAIAELAEDLRHLADFLTEWNASGKRIWYGNN
jgi:hypothetical protein